MKPQDIKVGTYYKHSNGFIYLGCGTRVMWEDKFITAESNFTNKQLVCLGHLSGVSLYTGQLVQAPDKCIGGFWDEFEEIV